MGRLRQPHLFQGGAAEEERGPAMQTLHVQALLTLKSHFTFFSKGLLIGLKFGCKLWKPPNNSSLKTACPQAGYLIATCSISPKQNNNRTYFIELFLIIN